MKNMIMDTFFEPTFLTKQLKKKFGPYSTQVRARSSKAEMWHSAARPNAALRLPLTLCSLPHTRCAPSTCQWGVEDKLRSILSDEEFNTALERKLEKISTRPAGLILKTMGIGGEQLKALVKGFIGKVRSRLRRAVTGGRTFPLRRCALARLRTCPCVHTAS